MNRKIFPPKPNKYIVVALYLIGNIITLIFFKLLHCRILFDWHCILLGFVIGIIRLCVQIKNK